MRIREEDLTRFIEEPRELLGEIINQLDPWGFAALALLFMRSGRIAIPLELDSDELKALKQLGADYPKLREALVTLEGSLAVRIFEAGVKFWKFRHPSIRDAIAKHVGARPDLIDIYLSGVKTAELLREVVCGDVEVAGATVHVPKSRFSRVISKIRGIDVNAWTTRWDLLSFLTSRCSDDFLALWFAECQVDFEQLRKNRFTWSYQYFRLSLALQRCGCLPEADRQAFVLEATERAIEFAESMVLCNEEFHPLFTHQELQSSFSRLNAELIPNLESLVDEVAQEYTDHREDPSWHFQDFASRLDGFIVYFEALGNISMVNVFYDGKKLVEAAVERLEDWKASEERREQQKQKEEAEQKRSEEWADYEEEMMERALWERDRWKTPDVPNAIEAPQPRFTKFVPPRSLFDDVDS